MSVIAGETKVSDLNQAQLVLDMEDQAAWLDQGSYLLETVTRKISGRKAAARGASSNSVMSVSRMKHEFRERRLMPMVAAVNGAGAAAAATSIPVADTTIFHRDHLIYAPATEEVFAMDEDVGGTAVVGEIKVRKLDSASGTGIVNALAATDILINLGEAHAEGEGIPPAYSTQEEDKFTYVMQFDRTRKSTDIEANEEHYGPSEIDNQRRQFWIETKRSLNMMLYAGQQVRETVSASDSRRRHVSRGLREYLATNRYDAAALSGGLTLTALGSIVRPTYQHTSSSAKKCFIAGLNAWTDISAWGDSYVRISPGSDQKWGVTFKELTTAFGDLEVGYDLQLRDTHGLADVSFVLDPEHIYQIQLQNMPLQLLLNRVNNEDIHVKQDVITGTRGLVLKLEELHREIYNLPA
jgi:hypothetical protein